MKIKVFFVIFVLIISAAYLHPSEFSLGFSYPLSSIYFEKHNMLNPLFLATPFPILLTPISLTLMFEFMPYIALEISPGASMTLGFYIMTFSLPILARFQYEFNRVLLYGSLGPNLMVTKMFVKPITGNKSAFMFIDMLFALGIEFRVYQASYLGLRCEYNYNLYKGYSEDSVDKFAVYFTYRYAFNSKHKIR